MGHPAKIPTSRKERGKWGTRRKTPLLAKDARNGAPGEKPHFSQRTREMGHPGEKWGTRLVGLFTRHRRDPHLCVGFLHALGPEALLRRRKPPFHYLELLSAQAAAWQSRALRPRTYCPRVDAGSLSVCRDRIRGHARACTSTDLRTVDWRSVEDRSGGEAKRLPAFGHCGR